MGRKKVTIIESDEGLLEGFVTQNLLKEPDKEKCLISEADLEIIKKNHALPSETIFFTHPNLTSECYSPEWVCFPEYPFLIGLKFPFPNLITKFFSSAKLNYAQIMPQGWRCLQTLVRLKDETGLNVGLEELAYTTEIRGFGLGRFCFRVRSGGEPIWISNNDPADRGWRNKFFFARKDSLGQEAGVISKWRSQEVAQLHVLFPEQEETEENVKKIFKLDPFVRSFRTFPVLFSAEKIVGLEEEVKLEESLPSSIRMSTATRSKTTVSAADLIAEAKAKRIVKIKGKPPTPKSAVSSSKTGSAKKVDAKKRKLEDVVVETNAKEKFGMLVKEFSDKGSDLMTFVMDQLAAKDEQLEILKKKADLDAEAARKKLKISTNEAGKLKREIVIVRKEPEKVHVEKVQENEAHLKELEDAKDDFKFNTTKALLEGRIQLMEEFKNGQAGTWDLEEEKKILDDFIGDQADGEEVNSPAPDAVTAQVNEVVQDLSTAVMVPVGEENQVEEASAIPAAAGQDV